MKNKPLFFLFIIFILLNIGDIYTTHYIRDAESNPIYYMFNESLIPMYIIKISVIIIIGFLWWNNMFPSKFTYYALVLSIVLSCLMLGMAVSINYNAMKNPELLEEATQTTIQERVQYYNSVVTIFYMFPMIFSLMAFLFYNISVKHIIIYKKKSSFGRLFKWIKEKK